MFSLSRGQVIIYWADKSFNFSQAKIFASIARIEMPLFCCCEGPVEQAEIILA